MTMNQQKHSGFSLIELLVALALGATLSAGISSVYLENKRNYVQDEEVARLQENGRFAVDVLKRELKLAGFFASIKNAPTAVPVLANDCISTGLWTFNANTPVDFINDAYTDNLPQSSAGFGLNNCIPAASLYGTNTVGSDVILIKRIADRPTMKRNNVVDPGVIKSDGTISPKAGWYVLDNNTTTTIEQLSISSSLFVSAVAQNSSTAAVSPEVWLYQSKMFWVRNCSVCSPSDGIPTLVVTHLDGNAYSTSALAEGVEVLHLEFGLASTTSDATSAPVQFTSNPTNAELGRISVVRVYLLLRTREEISGYTDDKSYVLGSKNIASADLFHGDTSLPNADSRDYKRRVFTTTIHVRNI